VIYEYYGATEGGGTMVRAKDWLAHPGTVGRPWPGADVKIFADDGPRVRARRDRHRLPQARDGVRVQGRPDKTRANRRGSYFTVGDVGELDARATSTCATARST
jgi:long-chain acyl-CoA synthetase